MTIPRATAQTTFANGTFYVDRYGAHHDTVTKSTIQTTAGSNVITDTANGFTSADTGKLALITGGGTNAQHLIGYLSYTNAATCTLVSTSGGSTAVNAATTLSRAGTMAYGTDDSTAIAAAHAAATAVGGSVVYGPYSYITSGTLGDAGSLYQSGSGRNTTKVYCTADYYWQNDATLMSRAYVHDITFFLAKHGFNDTKAAGNSSGFGQRVFENVEFRWHTGCAFQNNTSDGPWFKFNQCSFVGWDELETIGAAVGGLTDSTTFSACQFGGAHRVMLKLTHGGPNGSIEGNCGFISGLPAAIATLTDGAMTNGSNVVTSATDGRFDSSHLGLSITIPRATNLGSVANVGSLNTVITQVNSATQVTVMDAATATTSSAAVIIRSQARPERLVVDAVSTAGSKTITSATANFVAGDVASAINLVGAGFQSGTGGGAGELNTRIQSVTNSTTVIVDEAATTSVSAATMKINAPQIKIMLEPNDTVTNGGTGMTVDNAKFGSESVRPGDIHLGVVDSAVDASAADGAMTSGSAVLTGSFSAISGWVKTRYATIPGAGTNGTTLYARVIGYTSSSSVTLDATAGTTVTGKTVQITKPRGERMPVLNVASTGYQIQTDVMRCQFGNAGNSANGVIFSPIYSTTPNLRAWTFGPANEEYGSGYLYIAEYAPGVTGTADQYATTSSVFPMTDDNAGRSRLSAKISNRAGMFAKQLIDNAQTSGVRLPSFSANQGGSNTGDSQLLKTRIGSFTVNATAHKVNNLTDTDYGSDSAEYSFDTNAGIVSATIAQADIIVGEPVHIGFKVAAGSSNTINRMKVTLKYAGGSTHFQEYIDVPTTGGWVEMKTVFAQATGTVTLQFTSDYAGQVKITRPLVYHARAPINYGPRRWISPDGTSFTESIDNSGNLGGVSISGATAIPQKWKAGGYKYTWPGATSTVASVLGTLSWHPVWVPLGTPNSIDHLSVDFVTLGTNTTDPCVRLGIYADGGSYEPSGSPLLDAGLSGALSSTGEIAIATSYTWPAKGALYWLACVVQRLDQASTALGGTSPTLRIVLGSIGAHTTLITGGTSLGSGYHQAAVYGALPSPTIDYSTVAGTSKVWVKTV